MQASRRSDGLPPAIVLSAGSNALGVARSLHQVGVSSIAVALDDREPILLSRLPQLKVVVRGANENEGHLIEAMRDLRGARPVIIPTSDKFVDFLVRHRSTLAEDFDFCIPSDQLVRDLNDKVPETELIESIGLPMPRTVRHFPTQAEELVAALGMPIIVKPRSFRTLSFLQKKNVVLSTLDEVREFYRTRGAFLDKLIAQEVIPGRDGLLWTCSFTFNHDCDLVAAFTYCKLRTTPAHYGVPSYAISATKPEIIELVRRLGKRLRYTGVGNTEFKYDSRDGKYKYIETNPRLPMSNYFDTVCGVNNAYNAYRLARGHFAAPRELRQRDGVIYLSLFEDLYERLKDREDALLIVTHYLSNVGRRHVGAYFTWNDPLPGLISRYRDISRFLTEVLPETIASRQLK